jgi:hypothetical protein
MKRSKREVLTTDDINSALRLRNVEVFYSKCHVICFLVVGKRFSCVGVAVVACSIVYVYWLHSSSCCAAFEVIKTI